MTPSTTRSSVGGVIEVGTATLSGLTPSQVRPRSSEVADGGLQSECSRCSDCHHLDSVVTVIIIITAKVQSLVLLSS